MQLWKVIANYMYTDKISLQNYLLTNIDASFNTQITEWITMASRHIDRQTNRTFVPPTEDTEKLYDGNNSNVLIVDDLLEITTLKIDGVTISSDDYAIYPANKNPKTKIMLKYRVFDLGLQNVEVTGQFGYGTEVPPEIKWACTVLVSGIINASNQHEGEIQSESIGRYSVTYNTQKQLNDFDEAKKIITMYKRYAI